MELTRREHNVIQISLDHMEEHLMIIHGAGDICEETYNYRIKACETARAKISKCNLNTN